MTTIIIFAQSYCYKATKNNKQTNKQNPNKQNPNKQQQQKSETLDYNIKSAQLNVLPLWTLTMKE